MSLSIYMTQKKHTLRLSISLPSFRDSISDHQQIQNSSRHLNISRTISFLLHEIKFHEKKYKDKA